MRYYKVFDRVKKKYVSQSNSKPRIYSSVNGIKLSLGTRVRNPERAKLWAQYKELKPIDIEQADVIWHKWVKMTQCFRVLDSKRYRIEAVEV